MALMRFDPFRELDRLTEQLGSGTRLARTMPMEAYRRADEFVVSLDLPGVDPEDVDLTIEQNVVNIRASQRSSRTEGDELIVDERLYGEFTRQLFLGDNLDASKMSADFGRGVLTLTIPVAEKSKPRRIHIGASKKEARAIENESSTANAADKQPQHA